MIAIRILKHLHRVFFFNVKRLLNVLVGDVTLNTEKRSFVNRNVKNFEESGIYLDL